MSSATLSLLPPALRLFRKRFGGVELDLRELTSGEQIEAFHDGEIRVGLVRLPLRSPEIHLEPVLGEPFVVALPSGHPFEAHEKVSLEAIAEEDLIFFSRRLELSFHEQIVELLGRVGARPRVAQYAVHLQTVISLVASNIGVSILPASSVRVRWEGVVYRPLDAPDATSWLGLAWPERDGSALVENFVRTIHEVAEVETSPDYSKPGATS